MKPELELFDRREFFGVVTKTAAILGLAGAARAGAEVGTANPFAYDISRFQKTDPKLISHSETARWPVPRKESRRLAVGPDGRLYVCAGNYITRMGRDGRSGLELALDGPACCVAVAGDGTIFAGLRDHIEVFDAGGARTARWESPDPKTWFTGLAAGEKDVYAADAVKLAVLRYDRAGKITGRIGQKDAARNAPGLIVPSPFLDVIIHPDGLLRVNNPGRHQVESYTLDGDMEAAWGKPGAATEAFCGCCNPIALAALADGRIVTCEKGIPRVKIYSASGGFESVVAGAESFPENALACNDLNDCIHGGIDAAVDSGGRIYILDLVAGNVRVMERKA
jgi:sugar lactone lactonase YvrE